MIEKYIELPFTNEMILSLRVGEKLFLSGKLLTARDAAHKRMSDYLKAGDTLPFEIDKNCLYYCGPTPAKEGFPIGACGPTTSSRMDSYTDILFQNGLRCMIGKGNRSIEVIELIKQHKGIYLVAIGGAGALYGKTVLKSRCIAWEDLGTEAIYELEVKDFPCYVGIDVEGNNIYKAIINQDKI
ncbi:MAG: FumA C-terminus/TtdB family hydratase beta subunit [Candidatus Cloacimonetes bacterium]|nr:FumA C-terminus/TtdB family hydratase beta subunit [Candidatus Cloacimonadota bacterium]